MANLSDLWKKGTTAPMVDDLVEGGIGIDVAGKKVYSKASDGTIFLVGGGDGGDAPVDSVNGQVGVVVLQADDVGAAWEHHGHKISEVESLQGVLDGKYDESEHISTSAGVTDALKPITLNSQGQIDPSMIDTSTFYYVTTFTPAAGAEYPDTTGETPGAFWVCEIDYTFVDAGDLIGMSISVGDFMVWGAAGWSIMAGEMNPTLYYMLDGSNALTGAFAGGGQQLKNIGLATEAGDGVEFSQIDIGAY